MFSWEAPTGSPGEQSKVGKMHSLEKNGYKSWTRHKNHLKCSLYCFGSSQGLKPPWLNFELNYKSEKKPLSHFPSSKARNKRLKEWFSPREQVAPGSILVKPFTELQINQNSCKILKKQWLREKHKTRMHLNSPWQSILWFSCISHQWRLCFSQVAFEYHHPYCI